MVKEAPRHPSAGVTTSRREVLALYREILRTTRLFTWTNEQGVLWKDLLRDSARMEYEQARYETDPEVVARLLVVGRDAVQAAIDKAKELDRERQKRMSTQREPEWDITGTSGTRHTINNKVDLRFKKLVAGKKTPLENSHLFKMRVILIDSTVECWSDQVSVHGNDDWYLSY